MSINHYNRHLILGSLALKKKKRGKKRKKHEVCWNFPQVQCDPNSTLFPCIRNASLRHNRTEIGIKTVVSHHKYWYVWI